MKLTKQIMATLIDCFAIIVVWLILMEWYGVDWGKGRS